LSRDLTQSKLCYSIYDIKAKNGVFKKVQQKKKKEAFDLHRGNPFVPHRLGAGNGQKVSGLQEGFTLFGTIAQHRTEFDYQNLLH